MGSVQPKTLSLTQQLFHSFWLLKYSPWASEKNPDRPASGVGGPQGFPFYLFSQRCSVPPPPGERAQNSGSWVSLLTFVPDTPLL